MIGTLIWLWLYWKPALTGQDSKQHSSKLDAKEIVSYTAVREFYQPYPSQFCDVEQHYQIRARATKKGNEHVRAE